MKILIPTDFSSCANKAFRVALWLAQQSPAEIQLLHIESTPADWAQLDRYPEVTKRIEASKRQLDTMVAEASQSNIEAKRFMVYNKNYHAIVEHISEHKVDFVVMGSQGSSGLKEFVVGSNTQKIVRLSQVPVLVIKDNIPDDYMIKKIAFVSDFGEEVMDQFKQFVTLAQAWQARLYLLFVNTPTNFTDTLTTKIKMGNYAMHAPGMVENTFIYNDHNFEKGLQQFCEEEGIDLVGMITHGDHTPWQLFNNSLTESMVNHLDIPLLTMHFSNQE
ncbi:MAG: universal stress protein [Cyclobacteriaceae bacterium]|nr:universal stress protein [Cyclobacteriaceae bacterium]